MSEIADETIVRLQSNDNRTFEVMYKVAKQSATLKNMLDDLGATEESIIPLPVVNGPTLEKVIKYCEHHKDDQPATQDEDLNRDKSSEDIDAWDAEFIGNPPDQSFLFELILAANFLDIKPLLDLTCKTVANMIKGKTPEDIRRTFGIKNDFTPEEEEQVRKENEWCEEK